MGITHVTFVREGGSAIDQQCSVASHLRQLRPIGGHNLSSLDSPARSAPMFEADGDKCGREAAAAATEDDVSVGRASASGRTKGEGKFLEAFENENFFASTWRAFIRRQKFFPLIIA